MKRVLILLFFLANFATMAQRRIGIQDYSTVAALQAETINPSQNDKVYVKALQAVFAWDASSVATHNGVTVIKQTNITTGRFLLVGTSAYQLSGKLDATDTTTLLRKTTAAATYQPKGSYGILSSNNVWSGNNTFNSNTIIQGSGEVLRVGVSTGSVIKYLNSSNVNTYVEYKLMGGGVDQAVSGNWNPHCSGIFQYYSGLPGTGIGRFTIDNLGRAGFQDNATPTFPAAVNNSAILSLTTTTRGFLPPKMTQTQRNAISSPVAGLVVYCTDCSRLDGGIGVLQSYNGTSWVSAERRRSVIDYGATPNDGTDDTAAFLACISAEKEVYIPRGLFLVGTLTVPSDRKIYGDGASTILKANVNNARIFNIYNSSSSTSNVTIQDLQIHGGGQTTDLKTGIRAAYGVYVSNATNVNIINLVIDKCGVIHPTTDTLDNGYGGYGIMVEARGGEINNITIEKCRVTNIAGGGMVAGDGIYIAGYSSSTLRVPRNIYVRNCSVENVGRHCFTVAGERGVENASFGENVQFSDCNCRNAALSGVDLEEGSYVNISTMTIENAGNYTGYYNPITTYGANYRLCTGIAYGNLSVHNSYKNIKIKKSYYGITLGAGEYNHFDEIQIDSSTVADIILRLSHIGNNLTISNSRFLTPNLTAFNVYNISSNSKIIVQNCHFASPVNLTGVQYARFNNTLFNAPVNFTSTTNGKNEFVGCTFNQKVEFQINDVGFHTFDKCLFAGTTGLYFNTFGTYLTDIQAINSEFKGNQYGIYAVWKSIKNMKVDNCKFIGNTTASIYHANSDNEAPFLRISGNTFSNTVDAISINQATKFTKIADNTFRNVSGWCIKNTTILSGTSTTDLQIFNNQALSSCVNGIQIEVQTGSHDYNIIRGNNMRVCTGTKANISAGNSNGFQAENFF